MFDNDRNNFHNPLSQTVFFPETNHQSKFMVNLKLSSGVTKSDA